MLTTVVFSTLLPVFALAAPLKSVRQVASSPAHLHPGNAGGANLCLTVFPETSGTPANGDTVGLAACDTTFGNANQNFLIGRGDTLVQLAGTDFVLDAGSNPANFVGAKIWQSYGLGGVPQQQWYYTPDNRIAITGGTQCLDRANGGSNVQTYTCTTGDTNQVWIATTQGTPPISSTTVPPPSSTSSAAPSASTTPVVLGYTEIHPGDDHTYCLTAVNTTNAALEFDPQNNDLVELVRCNGGDNQKWTINKGNGKIKLYYNQRFCLDAGVSPHNNVLAKVYTCYDNTPQQQWYYTDDLRIAITGGNQCLDNANGVIVSRNPVQTYQCTTGNTNQVWTTGF